MNQLMHYAVPQWISIAFLLAIPLPFVLITVFVYKESRLTQYKKAYQTVISFFIIYLFYVILASYKGWFNQVSLPPRVLLLTTFPFAFLLFIVVGNSNVYKTMLHNAAIENIVYLHIFRVIGVFFILLALNEALPKPFAFIAGIGDILTAITSIYVAQSIKIKKTFAKKLTFYWNVFGTLDILFTAIAANAMY
jgi:hypothetical protein